jgi:GTP-binding protein
VPVLCVANKIDNETFENETSKFLALGFGEVIAISCIHNFGFPDLQRGIGSLLKDVAKKNKKKKRESLRLAFAGRRNVGKSSLTNLLCGEKRVIVSNEAGTTRDAVDVEVDYNGMALTLIDTAGLRKKNQTEDSIEFFSVNRTFGALYRADVGILMLDAEQGISQVDQKLGRWFSDHHKLCVIVVNKWDLAKGKTTHAEYDTYVHDRLPGLGYVPIIYISVLEDLGVNVLFDTIQTLLEQVKSEHTTHQLNEILKLAQMRKKPRLVHGSVPKLFYISALKQMPPTYLIFGKSTERIMDNYKRYLHQFLRKSLKKEMLPIQLVFKNRKSLFKDTE